MDCGAKGRLPPQALRIPIKTMICGVPPQPSTCPIKCHYWAMFVLVAMANGANRGDRRTQSSLRSQQPDARFGICPNSVGLLNDDSPGCLLHPHIQLVPESAESSPANNPRSVVSSVSAGKAASHSQDSMEGECKGRAAFKGRAVRSSAVRASVAITNKKPCGPKARTGYADKP